MNKLLTKIVGLSLGLSMAIGVGVAAVAIKSSQADPVEAAMPSGYTLITSSNLSTTLTTSDKVVICTSDGSMGVTGYSGSDATVAASGWLEFAVTNISGSNYSLKNASTNKWISNLASNKFNIASSSQTDMLATSDGRFSYMDGAATPAQRWLAQNGSYYRCYTNGTSTTWTYFYVYKAPAQTGSITSVTVKGPNDETGSMTAPSGFEGAVTVQLSVDVVSSGVIDTSVQWSTTTPSICEVDSTGKVRLLSSGSAIVTATSKADNTKANSITINASGIVAYTGSTDVGDFTNTTKWGTTTIPGGEFSGTLTNISFADGGTPSGSTGVAYNKEGNMRVYNKTILSLATSAAYEIEYVIITCKSTGKLSVTPTCANGTFSILELSGVLDCSSNPSNSLSISFGGTSYIETMTVYYASTGSCGVVIDAISQLTKGDSGTFTATPSDATNPSYTWSATPSGIISVNASSGAYSVTGYGVVTLSVDMTCDEGSASDSVELIVNAGLIDIAEAETICSNLASDEVTEYKVTMSGYIVAKTSSSFTISDEKVDGGGDTFLIYGPSDSVKNYAILNGTICYQGKLTNYKGTTHEMKNLTLVSYTDDAIEYATASYNSLNEACVDGPAAVTSEQWETLASNYNDNVDSYSKAKLTAEDISHYGTAIANWRDRYERIVNSGKTDFMNLNSSGSKVIFNTVFGDSNNTITIIAIIAVISVSAIGGFFFLRKRKEQ